jgi:hypothetical protein
MTKMFGKKKSREGAGAAQTSASALSNLSPTSYARQFDDLDNTVAAAALQGGGEVDDEELAKNMNALSLKMSRGKQQGGNNILDDFDADSDGVFEDDSGDDDDDDDIKSDTAGGGVIIDNSSLLSRLKKGKFKKNNIDEHRGRQASSTSRGSRYSSSASHSIAMTDEGGGRGRGGATSASSSSSSMGDDASVGTTESEDELDGVGGKTKKSGHGSDSAEDYTDDEDEGEDGYKPGGYHPVKVGEVYNQR